MSLESINLLAKWAEVSPLLISVAIIWSLVWKGLALWRAAELRQKYWFTAILVINSLGILDIIYLFVVARNQREGQS